MEKSRGENSKNGRRWLDDHILKVVAKWALALAVIGVPIAVGFVRAEIKQEVKDEKIERAAGDAQVQSWCQTENLSVRQFDRWWQTQYKPDRDDMKKILERIESKIDTHREQSE